MKNRKSIQEYLGVPKSWHVRENVKHKIVLMPNEQDLKKADPKNPMGCALHNAACRIFGIPNAAIGGRWAYIPQRDQKGRYYIARMQATVKTQIAIQLFDKNGKMPKYGFEFRPIAQSHTFAYKRRYQKAWQKGLVGHNRKPRSKANKRRITRCIPRLVDLAA